MDVARMHVPMAMTVVIGDPRSRLNGNNLGVDDGGGEATEDDISSLETHSAVHGPDVAKYHSGRPWSFENPPKKGKNPVILRITHDFVMASTF